MGKLWRVLGGSCLFFSLGFLGCADEQGNLDTNIRHVTPQEFLYALDVRHYNVPQDLLPLMTQQTVQLANQLRTNPALSQITAEDVRDTVIRLSALVVGIVNSPAGREALAARNIDPLIYPLYPMLNAMVGDPQDPIQSTIDLVYGMLKYPGGLPAVVQGTRPLLVAILGEGPIVDTLAPPIEEGAL